VLSPLAGDREGDAPALVGSRHDLIAEIDSLKDGGELVESVRPCGTHGELQIHLRWNAHGDGVRGHHVRLCRIPRQRVTQCVGDPGEGLDVQLFAPKSRVDPRGSQRRFGRPWRSG